MKKVEINDEIKAIVKNVDIFMIEKNINSLEEKIAYLRSSPRPEISLWHNVCIKLYGSYVYTKAMRLRKICLDNESFFLKLLNNIIDETVTSTFSMKQEKNFLEIIFEKDEWEDLIKNASVGRRKKFLVHFHNILAARSQTLGIKCWLKCNHNWSIIVLLRLFHYKITVLI